jgi:hypothetical protein
MASKDIHKRLADAQNAYEAAQAAHDTKRAAETWGYWQDLRDHAREMAQRDRVAAAATADVRAISARGVELQKLAKGATPLELAELQGRTADETEARGRRIGELNAKPAGPAGDPLAVQRQAIRSTFDRLQATNPIAASCFQERNSWAWNEEPEPEGAA